MGLHHNFFKTGLIVLLRGTASAHIEGGTSIRRGNLTLVSDAPELRYHDGKTVGGVAIPLPEEVWNDIREAYAHAGERNTPAEEPRPGALRRLFNDLRIILGKNSHE